VDALARGKTAEEVRAEGVAENLVLHKVFPGDRPSIQILFKKEVNPFNVGQLLALYEHRVAVCGYEICYMFSYLWNINSFDQWGVELGKVLAKNVKSVLVKNPDPNHPVDFSGFNANSATKHLIEKYRSYQL
jgi:glucose-6-phosphate isomerase